MLVGYILSWIFFSILFTYLINKFIGDDLDMLQITAIIFTFLMLAWPITVPLLVTIAVVYGVVRWLESD